MEYGPCEREMDEGVGETPSEAARGRDERQVWLHMYSIDRIFCNKPPISMELHATKAYAHFFTGAAGGNTCTVQSPKSVSSTHEKHTQTQTILQALLSDIILYHIIEKD